MTYLLDTNVISEMVKSKPDPGVIDWLASADEDQLFLSVVTLAELRHGIERLPNGKRRDALDRWLVEELAVRFEGRLLPIDQATADEWGRLVARSRSQGRPIGAMDAFMAATAERHRLVLVTRNVSDFETVTIRLLNPWARAEGS